MGHEIPARETDKLMISKKINKQDKYLDFAKELKKIPSTNGTVIPIVIGTPGSTPKGLVRGLKEL